MPQQVVSKYGNNINIHQYKNMSFLKFICRKSSTVVNQLGLQLLRQAKNYIKKQLVKDTDNWKYIQCKLTHMTFIIFLKLIKYNLKLYAYMHTCM